MTASTAPAGVARFEENLDRAADEVFSTMMGVRCFPAAAPIEAGREAISAVIGLAGAMSGSLVLQCGSRTAIRIAEQLTGIVAEGVDAMVRDAMGEVCNMIAGAWKGLDESLACGCLLSTPTVVSGCSYALFTQRAPIRIERAYRFEDRSLTLTVCCEIDS